MKLSKNLILSILWAFIIVLPFNCFGQENDASNYNVLNDYEGSYEYINNSRLQLAASPRDKRLYAIINEVRFPLKAVGKDSFLDVQNTKVTFERNALNEITGYRVANSFFKRITKENFSAEMWYPRYVPNGNRFEYRYAAPADRRDGLPVGALSKTGLNPALLKEMVEKIADETYKNVHSVLIVKDGRLVFEEYFYEYDQNKLHQLRSTTKSVVSALVGIAIEKGFIKSVSEPVLAYFPEYDVQNLSEDKRKITIEDLLTNQSGLACDDDDKNSPGNESKMGNSADWVKFTLDLPMIDRPGNSGRYCSGGVIVLGRIVEKTTRKPLKDFAAENLFTPLGVADFKWNFKPDRSSAETFCQIYLTPRAMAKFGLLYLNDGKFGGKSLISESWVNKSLAKQSTVNNTEYGYLWWRQWLDVDGKRVEGTAAKGYGGQRIFLWRDLNMIAVVTGGNYNGNSPSDELLIKYILPPFAK